MIKGRKSIGIMVGITGRPCQIIRQAIWEQNEKEFGDECEFLTDINTQWYGEFETPSDSKFALSDRKILAFNEAETLLDEGWDIIANPDFKAGLYSKELQREIPVPIIDINTVIEEYLLKCETSSVIGVLEPQNIVQESLLSERFKIICPTPEEDQLLDETREEYTGEYDDRALETLEIVCKRMIEAGAQIIVPNNMRFAVLQKQLVEKGFPILDVIPIFAHALITYPLEKKPFKLGLIGAGSTATIDLYNKIVKATSERTDQEPIKVVIEQNPLIDDQTVCELDPTVALYRCAKRLQMDGCDCAIIFSNTAHAFLPRVLRNLDMPFIDMQQTMLDAIQGKFGDKARVGLLATDGTIRMGIYGKKAEKMNMAMFIPDDQHQELIMSAIYGAKGIQAGFRTGKCYENLYNTAEYLVKEHNCNVLILGCSELSLILHEQDDFEVAGTKVAIVDPVAISARKCVEIADNFPRSINFRSRWLRED